MVSTRILVTMTIFILTATAQAEIFCVGSEAQLTAALDVAAVNAESDEIHILQGTYVAPADGFDYDSNQNDRLRVSGGWQDVKGNCRFQSVNPYNTRLDGNDQEPIFYVSPGQFANVEISNLFFFDGLQGGNFRGGAIELDSSTASPFGGLLTIEQCAFMSNTAIFGGSAVFGQDGRRMTFRNNIFADNFGAGVVSWVNAQEFFFINNTVLNNTANSGATAAVKLTGTSGYQAFIANNILTGNQGRDLQVADGGGGFIWNNLIGVLQNNGGLEERDNLPNTTLLEFEPGVMNFTLVEGSSLADAGVEPPRFTSIPVPFEQDWSPGETDFFGASRVMGDGIDLGAVETPPVLPDEMFTDGFEL